MDPEETASPVRTGLDHVDAVVSEVDALGDRPLTEHVTVFEDAHDRLRRALDQTPPG